MYIHIGGEYQIPIRNIIAVFDFDELTNESDTYTLNLLAEMEEKFVLETVSQDIPRSLILTHNRAYLSPINPSTIENRLLNANRLPNDLLD